jgi:hypothetical protein
MGHSTVPWGTPEVTAIFSDVVFSKSTVCVLFAKKDVIQFVSCQMGTGLANGISSRQM